MRTVLRGAGLIAALLLALLAILFVLDLAPRAMLLRESLRVFAILGILTAFVLIAVLLLRKNDSA